MNKDEQLLIRLTAEEKGKLKSMAKREKTTMAKLIKSRVFSAGEENLYGDLRTELRDYDKKLFLLLDNAKRVNDNQEKIIELLNLMSIGVGYGDEERPSFDDIIHHIYKYFIDRMVRDLGITGNLEEKRKLSYVISQFQDLIQVLENSKKKDDRNA